VSLGARKKVKFIMCHSHGFDYLDGAFGECYCNDSEFNKGDLGIHSMKCFL
jgi:hypothetical protein